MSSRIKVCRSRNTNATIKWKPLLVGTVKKTESEAGDKVEFGGDIKATNNTSDFHSVSPEKQLRSIGARTAIHASGSVNSSGTIDSNASDIVMPMPMSTIDRMPSFSTTDVSRSPSTATFSSLNDSNHPTTTKLEDKITPKEIAGDSEAQNKSRAMVDGREKRHRSREPRLLPEHIEEAGVEKILNALTDDERSALPDINMPLRHLRAEKGDVDQAILKCKATLAWRKRFGVRHIVSSFNDDRDDKNDSEKERKNEFRNILLKETETGKIYVRGHDKNGRSIMYMRPQRENTNDIENNMRNLVYNLERAICSTGHQTKEELEKVNIVIDYDGFTLSKAPPMKATMYTLEILQAHYCERLHRAYMCNTPAMFRVFWRMVKPFVDPTTKERIVFCNGPEGKAAVLEQQPDLSCLEECVFGKLSSTDYDHEIYLKEIPFHQTL